MKQENCNLVSDEERKKLCQTCAHKSYLGIICPEHMVYTKAISKGE